MKATTNVLDVLISGFAVTLRISNLYREIKPVASRCYMVQSVRR